MLDSIKKYGLLIQVGLFIILFRPPLVAFNLMHVVGCLSWGYIVWIKGSLKNVTFSELERRFIFFFIFIAYYVYFFCVILNETSFQSLAFPVYFFLDVFPFAVVCREYSLRHSCSVVDFFNMLLAVCCYQSLFAIVAFLSPQIHLAFTKLLINYGYGNSISLMSEHRLFGFAGELTFATPVLLSFFSVVALVLFVNSKFNIGYLIVSVSLFFTALLNARASIIVFLLGIVLFLVVGKLAVTKKIFFLLGVICISACFSQLLLPAIRDISPLTYDWLNSGWNEIFVFLGEGDTDGEYFSYVTQENIYRLPDFPYYWIGQGIWVMTGDNQYGFHSDVGFINDIWFGGFIYALFIYLFFVKNMLMLYNKKNSILSFVGLYFLLAYLILNFKGYIFFVNGMTNIFIILCIICGEDRLLVCKKCSSFCQNFCV